ncbi:MAG: hypothetical protein LBM78_01375, partial [Clostridiales bacterium]|nr:hypothetical protein [Clostridiales bacterium]
MNTSQKNGSLIAPLFARETPPPHEVVAEVGRGLFRTSEDEGLVAEAVAGLLARGWYATAAVLVQAALLNRSFGSHHYVGHRYDYTAAERFFDKFVDMCVHFELGDRLVPFCVYALSSRDEASGWARPAGEYLAALAERDRAGTLSEVLALPGAGEALQAITVLGGHVDEVAAIAVDRLLNGGVAARAEVRGYLSANKRYALDGLLAGLAGNTPTREQAMKALLLFKQDETVKAALRGAFAVEPSAALRRLLQAELGVRFASEVISTPAALEARARGSTVRGTTNAF